MHYKNTVATENILPDNMLMISKNFSYRQISNYKKSIIKLKYIHLRPNNKLHKSSNKFFSYSNLKLFSFKSKNTENCYSYYCHIKTYIKDLLKK